MESSGKRVEPLTTGIASRRSISVEICPLAALMVVERGRQQSMSDPRMARQLLRLVRMRHWRVPDEHLWLTGRRQHQVGPLLLRLLENGGIGLPPVPCARQPLVQRGVEIILALNGGCFTQSRECTSAERGCYGSLRISSAPRTASRASFLRMLSSQQSFQSSASGRRAMRNA